ncbi:MAG: hypothetical protein ACK476_12340 [Fluviicola sp.]|jgi:hypothetical protein
MKKYFVWILVYAVLLIAIPLLIEYKYILPAKILGFILVSLITISIRVWLRKANKLFNSEPKVVLTNNDRFDLDVLIPVYKNWSNTNRKEFERKLSSTITKIDFDNFDHSTPLKRNCLAFCSLLIAASPDAFGINTKRIVVFKPEVNLEKTEINGVQYIFIGVNYIETQLKLLVNSHSDTNIDSEFSKATDYFLQ